MGKYAIVIALEKYRDSTIHDLEFVENDGAQFKSVLSGLGFLDKNILYLLNDYATKANIESELRNILRRLTKEDEFIFFFSGAWFFKK